MELSLSVEGWTRLKPGVGGVIVMPAGVSHEMADCSEDILMAGGYSDGRDWDNIQEKFLTEELFRQAAKRIMMPPIPSRDPVTGEALQQWLDAPSSVDGGWNDFRDGLDASSQGGRARCVDGNSIAQRGEARALPLPWARIRLPLPAKVTVAHGTCLGGPGSCPAAMGLDRWRKQASTT